MARNRTPTILHPEHETQNEISKRFFEDAAKKSVGKKKPTTTAKKSAKR